MSEMVYFKAEVDDDSGAETTGVLPAASGGGGGGTVGRLVDTGQADDRRMIRLVRARRLLYARNNMPVASYYARVKCLWEEVADEMGWTVADVRRKWSHIRNSYSRHLRNELAGARTGRGRAVSRWYLADELEFLREHMATDTRPAFQHYPPTLLQMDMSEAEGAGGGSGVSDGDGEGLAGGWVGGLGVAVKREPVMAGSEDSCGSAATAPAPAADEGSSYLEFWRGLQAEYRALVPRRRRLFKRQALQLLHALLDDQERDSSTLHAPYLLPDAVNLSHPPSDSASPPDDD